GASKKQKHKKRQYNPARADRSSPAHPAGLTVGPSWARCVGEHLGCSPCGELAGRALVSTVGRGPEVLLSLLPLATLHYTVVTIFQEFGSLRAAGLAAAGSTA